MVERKDCDPGAPLLEVMEDVPNQESQPCPQQMTFGWLTVKDNSESGKSGGQPSVRDV